MRPAQFSKIVRVLGYCRVSGHECKSTTEQRERLKVQEADIRAWCKANDLPEPVVYAEIESAAGGVAKKEAGAQQRQLLADVRAADLVIVRKLDRWSRDVVFDRQSYQAILDRKADWFSVAEPMLAPGDLFMRTMFSNFAEYERETIRRRLVGSRQAQRKEGGYTEGLPPFGYRRAPRQGNGRLEDRKLHPSEHAPIVHEMFARSEAGQSTLEIMEWLKAEHPVRKWKSSGIGYTLRARVYLGELETWPGNGEWKKAHEPIVERDLWLKVQAALDSRKLGGKGRQSNDGEARTHHWLLKGLATCTLCGSRIGGAYGLTKDGARHRDYYGCNARISARKAGRHCTATYQKVPIIDAKLTEELWERLKEVRSILTVQPDAAPAPQGPNFDVLKAKLKTKRSRLVETYTDGDIEREEYKKRLTGIDREIASVEGQEAQAKARQAKADPKVKKDVLTKLDTLSKVYSKMTVPERRELLSMLATDIKVDPSMGALVTWKSADDLLAVRGSYLAAG